MDFTQICVNGFGNMLRGCSWKVEKFPLNFDFAGWYFPENCERKIGWSLLRTDKYMQVSDCGQIASNPNQDCHGGQCMGFIVRS